MAEYSTILFDVRSNVAYITLNRAEAANALNAELAHDLMEVSLRCEEDPSVLAVLINAAGKIFCAGGDLKSFAAQFEWALKGLRIKQLLVDHLLQEDMKYRDFLRHQCGLIRSPDRSEMWNCRGPVSDGR